MSLPDFLPARAINYPGAVLSDESRRKGRRDLRRRGGRALRRRMPWLLSPTYHVHCVDDEPALDRLAAGATCPARTACPPAICCNCQPRAAPATGRCMRSHALHSTHAAPARLRPQAAWTSFMRRLGGVQLPARPIRANGCGRCASLARACAAACHPLARSVSHPIAHGRTSSTLRRHVCRTGRWPFFSAVSAPLACAQRALHPRSACSGACDFVKRALACRARLPLVVCQLLSAAARA